MNKKGNDLKLRKFKPGLKVNLYQEDWHPFQNLPKSLRNFTAQTGVKVNLIWDKLISPKFSDKMWNEMERSFIEEEPPFDLMCADPMIINQFAKKERVEKLNNYIKNDGYDLTDFETAALDICTQGKDIFGLPSCNVSNLLMYRVDLFDKYKISLPKTMEELAVKAISIQQAVRDDGNKDFYGITARGATGAGYIGWIIASSWAPSWGVDFYNNNNEINIETQEHISAIEHFVDLLKKAAPPEEYDMTWTESLDYYETGRTAMIIEVGTEFAHLYKKGGSIIEDSRCAVIPTGPCGKPRPGLYSPSFAIPKRSKVKEAAWELAKFLCSSKQQLEDALLSDAIETASNSALESLEMDKHFKTDLLEAVRANREFARDERPYSKHGLKPLSILGDEYNSVLRNKKSAQDAMREAAEKIRSLGPRW